MLPSVFRNNFTQNYTVYNYHYNTHKGMIYDYRDITLPDKTLIKVKASQLANRLPVKTTPKFLLRTTLKTPCA